MAFDSKQAKDIAEAIKYLANNAKSPEKDWGDKRKSMDFVKANIAQIKGEGIEIKQKIDYVNDDACKINFTVNTTDDKGKSTEEIFEFSLSDMNKMMVEYKVSGKMIQIKLVCKNQEKFIKVYKNGQQQAFNNDVIILEEDVDKAKNISDALRNAIIKCEQ
ncbi:MAG: hypothetical protein IPK03_13390 [Bacteroidetes bacterium]|nr:hypothetical protein [Bacteroidota bacterium]